MLMVDCGLLVITEDGLSTLTLPLVSYTCYTGHIPVLVVVYEQHFFLRCVSTDGLATCDEDHFLLFWWSGLL